MKVREIHLVFLIILVEISLMLSQWIFNMFDIIIPHKIFIRAKVDLRVACLISVIRTLVCMQEIVRVVFEPTILVILLLVANKVNWVQGRYTLS